MTIGLLALSVESLEIQMLLFELAVAVYLVMKQKFFLQNSIPRLKNGMQVLLVKTVGKSYFKI